MLKLNLFLLLSLFCLRDTFAQNKLKADSLYQAGLNDYEQQNKVQAMQRFKEALDINPEHTDALFNFGVVNYELGNQGKAYALFQQGVKLHDRNAAKLLKELGQAIAYADTMHIDDVDEWPKFMNKGKLEDVFGKDLGINSSLQFQMGKEIMSSALVHNKLGKNLKIYATLMFLNDGRLKASMIIDNKGQREMQDLLFKNIELVPAKHAGMPVSIWGIHVPISLKSD